VIRVAALDEFDPQFLKGLCKHLYTAFGVGAELTDPVRPPSGMAEPFDAEKLLEAAPTVRAFRDDKVLYLTRARLKDRVLGTGTVPTHGHCRYGKDRALVTTFGLKDLEAGLPVVSRHALHAVGHLWDLYHCLDPRCAMYPPWTPSFARGESTFCTFCREKSERKIALAKS
jgi:archaemetzincin